MVKLNPSASASRLRIREVRAKSILNPSRIGGVTYAINPYVGCQHGCVYCYARFMQRYTGHQGEEWGSFVDVKVNAVEVLRRQLRRMRRRMGAAGRGQVRGRGAVLLSSVTDAYQPLERRFRLTRGCLELLRDYELPVSILTKSDLVLRDADLLGEVREAEVGMTIITLEERVRRVFEAKAPPSERRLAALRELASQGLRTFAFIGPIIPYLSMPTLEELVRRLADGGIEYLFFDRLYIKYGNWRPIERVLRTAFPERYGEVCAALRPSNPYYEELRIQVVELAQRYGVEAECLF